MIGSKLITRAELPNNRGLFRVIGQSQIAFSSTINSAEIVLSAYKIPAGSWNINEGFILDFSGFYSGAPLTIAQFRIRVVGNGGLGPPNNIVAEFTHAPAANAVNVVRGNVMIGRAALDDIRFTYQIIPGSGLTAAVNAGILGGYQSSFGQDIIVQLNAAITATTPAIEYSQNIFYKIPKV